MTSVRDQTVLVTGANRGVGREFVEQLLTRGVGTVYAGARDPESVTSTDPRVVAIRLDITDPVSVQRAAEQIGGVDIVINNAGISLGASVTSADDTSLRREFEVNLFGPLAVTAAFVDGVVERSGAIVNVASALSWLAVGGTYSAAKAALWSATDSMRVELAPRGVQVVGVYMGYVDTDMTAGVDAPKTTPAAVVTQVLDALEAGEQEVLADDTARQVRGGLHLPVAERYEAFLPATSRESA